MISQSIKRKSSVNVPLDKIRFSKQYNELIIGGSSEELKAIGCFLVFLGNSYQAKITDDLDKIAQKLNFIQEGSIVKDDSYEIIFPDYSSSFLGEIPWEGRVTLEYDSNELTLKTDSSGNIFLARICFSLATDSAFIGAHAHLDAIDGYLEKGSNVNLVISRLA